MLKNKNIKKTLYTPFVHTYCFAIVLGLGYEITKWLAAVGADVVIACRSEQRASEVYKAKTILLCI